jgi:endonuclease/exonuclease/phosphatase family metal-dependent hydrolase
VRATIGGATVRFVAVHLEAESPQVQARQVDELLARCDGERLPLILAGDLNSPADGSGTPAYARLVAGGFRDAWPLARPGDPGDTCCHDALLVSPAPVVRQRIDAILVRGPVQVLDATLVGLDPARRTANGLWPSDHAGLIATLRIPSAAS